MIWRDELQCGTVQLFPAWHVVIWLSTFFIVLQCGSEQYTSPLPCDSRRWHLCAWSSSTSCCWMSLRFSGSTDRAKHVININVHRNCCSKKYHNSNQNLPVVGAGVPPTWFCVAVCGPGCVPLGAPDCGWAGEGAGGCVCAIPPSPPAPPPPGGPTGPLGPTNRCCWIPAPPALWGATTKKSSYFH